MRELYLEAELAEPALQVEVRMGKTQARWLSGTAVVWWEDLGTNGT